MSTLIYWLEGQTDGVTLMGSFGVQEAMEIFQRNFPTRVIVECRGA